MVSNLDYEAWDLGPINVDSCHKYKKRKVRVGLASTNMPKTEVSSLLGKGEAANAAFVASVVIS